MNISPIRNINNNDFNKYYLYLLNQLSPINFRNFSKLKFNEFIKNLSNKHQIYVIEDSDKNKIIGTITIIIESKIIHIFGKVCHIEDLVIDKGYQNLKLGTKLINFAIEKGKEEKCYKVILNCSNEYKNYYIKKGFYNSGNQMRKDII